LWEPPGIDLVAGQDGRRSLRAELGRAGVMGRLRPTGHIVRHTITHHRIEVEVWRASALRESRTAGKPNDVRWIDPRKPAVALTALGRRLISLTDC
jgi:adenine-specific DNA glycosylase